VVYHLHRNGRVGLRLRLNYHRSDLVICSRFFDVFCTCLVDLDGLRKDQSCDVSDDDDAGRDLENRMLMLVRRHGDGYGQLERGRENFVLRARHLRMMLRGGWMDREYRDCVCLCRWLWRFGGYVLASGRK